MVPQRKPVLHDQDRPPKGVAVSLVAEEKILVVPTALFHELGYFQGFSRDVERYWPRLLEGDHVEYRPRGQMEDDPSFKQLIPYVLFRWTADDGTVHLFEYLRGSGQGERRLHAKRSVGVGGHISSVDADSGLAHDAYLEGMARELAEEVVVNTGCVTNLAGLLNDDETPVGRVHLGVVHIADVEQPHVEPREDDIQDCHFSPVSDILQRLDQFESWSEIAVRALFS
jgi:predicted NUDIX family phosphoesterase